MVQYMLFILLVLFNSESVLCVLQLSCIFVPKNTYNLRKCVPIVFGFCMAGVIKMWISVLVLYEKNRLRDYFTENFNPKKLVR